MIQMVIMDVDGVLTDGLRYSDGSDFFLKTISFKDLDAIHEWKCEYTLAVISGERNSFTEWLKEELDIPFFIDGCKDKLAALDEILKKTELNAEQVCYIGDGRYDIPVLQRVGFAVCPADAIPEVLEICHLVLKRNGGQGCMAELFFHLKKYAKCLVGKLD